MLCFLHHLLYRFKKGVLVSSKIKTDVSSYGPLDMQTSVIKIFLKNKKAFRNSQQKKHINK